MSRIFITSDRHIGDRRVIGHWQRPFTSMADMHQTMIENWNAIVSPEDYVIDLGDLCMDTSAETLETVSKFNGKTILVTGNHDSKERVARLQRHGLLHKVHRSELFIGNNLVLSHEPVESKTLQGRDTRLRNIHGHTHCHTRPKQLGYKNVCVEQTCFEPVDLARLVSPGEYDGIERITLQ